MHRLAVPSPPGDRGQEGDLVTLFQDVVRVGDLHVDARGEAIAELLDDLAPLREPDAQDGDRGAIRELNFEPGLADGFAQGAEEEELDLHGAAKPTPVRSPPQMPRAAPGNQGFSGPMSII